MSLIADLKALEPSQRSAIWASYLGWTLDAFDFFLMVFVSRRHREGIRHRCQGGRRGDFPDAAARPFGAFIFGWLADRFGRRPVLMVDILLFSVLRVRLGASRRRSTMLLVLRALFGFAMGGEWGIGAALAMESIPAKLRGPVSGLLQSGYPSGYFARQPRLFACCSTRSAGAACSWSASLPALLVLLHPPARAGMPGVRGAQRGTAARPIRSRRLRAPLEDRALPGRADDRVQLLQPRHAGPLSDLPPETAPFRHPHDRHARRRS